MKAYIMSLSAHYEYKVATSIVLTFRRYHVQCLLFACLNLIQLLFFFVFSVIFIAPVKLGKLLP